MHQQQDQQQRSTFYRANRPGNLNIIDINENQLQIQHSPLIQQHQQLQQQQQMLMPPSSSPYLNQNYKVHQSPLAPPPIPYSSNHMLTSTPNQQSNYVPQSLAPPISPAAINSNNNANNTHYPTSPSYNIVNKQQQKYQQQQQQQQPQYSPSYTTNNTNNTNPQTPYAAASYTPNYSPCQSSANIVNKQTQYFNFDASNINNNNNNNNIQSIPQQSPRLFNSNSNNNTNSTNITSANNNGSTNLYHQSNQGTTSRYTQQQQKLQNGNYHHQSNFGNNGNVYQFQNNYHKMPSTPQSAIPMSSTSTNNLYVNHNHSLSVPNSPLVNNNNSNNNSNSIFQFNMSIQQSLQDTTPSVLKTRQYIENQQQQQQQQEKILNTSYEFETNEPNDQHCEVTDEIGETAEIKTNTYGENEIEMVEQVLNDMMQKEEIIKVTSVESNSIDATNCEINNTDDLVISNDNDDDNNNISTPTNNNNNNNNDDDDDDESLIKNNEASLLTNNIDFNQTNSTIPLNSTSASTPNTNITNSTNSNVSFEKDNKTYNKIDNNCDMNKNNINNNNNKNSVFSLSNLSAAASAEFEYMFNFNNDTANKQQRIDNNNNNNNETYKNFNNNKTNIALITKQQQQQQQHLNDSSLKLKQYDADINEFQKNNFNNKTMSQEIKKEAYPSKMDLDQQNIFNNNNNNSKSSITDRDISYKFSVLDQPINMNHKNKLINRSIQGNEFSISSTNSSINNGNNNNNNNTAQNCSDCGKIFTNKSALAKHRLIHSNERKYACHLCDKSFKRQDHLNGHLLTHQDKKPFECKAPRCDKSYCDSRSLKRHVESQHQDYLEAVARGNHQVLNYLPNIGKLKANVAPNLQHEIIVNETQATSKIKIKIYSLIHF
jgi:hypothetical protein